MLQNTIKIILTLSCISIMSSSLASSYRVKDGQALDRESYQGYVTYRQWCARCHGAFGQGGPNVPDLTRSLKELSQQGFKATVTSGGQQSAKMPVWRNNPQVMQNLDAIYQYLKARSDKAIGPIRPELIR